MEWNKERNLIEIDRYGSICHGRGLFVSGFGGHLGLPCLDLIQIVSSDPLLFPGFVFPENRPIKYIYKLIHSHKYILLA